MKSLLMLVCLAVAGSFPPPPETVSVTVSVGNGGYSDEMDILDIVIDTETLVLTESETGTGTFRSGAVHVTIVDTDENLAIMGDWLKDVIPGHPLDRNYPDVAEVPDVAHFAEVNPSLVVLMLACLGVLLLLWILYNRKQATLEADDMVDLSEEDIQKKNPTVLWHFCKRHPDHPKVRSAAIELGRRFYKNLDYDRAAHFFQTAIRTDRRAKNAEAHYYLGHCRREQDYLCDAIDEWVACYLDEPDGPLAQEAFREAQRWRAHQLVHDREECPQCGADCRITDMRCVRCDADLKRTLVDCGVCGKTMLKEAQLCIHCLPDDIKVEVATGTDWPILRTTALDWEAELIRSRLESEHIPCVLTGEKGRAIPLTVGYLGEIHIRVHLFDLAEAQRLLSQISTAESPSV